MLRFLAFFCTAIVIMSLSILLSTELSEAKDKLDGKKLYTEYCRPCHSEDSSNGEYSPMSLIQDQWDEFFKENLIPTHEGVVDTTHENNKVLDLLNPEMLKAIHKWAFDHAADSEQPMSCDVNP